jgi:tetratricopeptide (TPR) repeat protein
MEIRYRLGLVLLKQDKLRAANDRFELVAKSDPASPLMWLGVAESRLRIGRREEALRAADRAASLAPGTPLVWRALAMFYARCQDFAMAADCELRWAASAPHDTASKLRAIEFHIRARAADAAIELAKQVPNHESSALVRSMLARCYRLKSDPVRAVEELQLAIKLEPSEPAHYAELAQLFVDHRTLEPAQIVLEFATRRFRNDTRLLMLLGLTYYGNHRLEQALDTFLRVIDVNPDSEQAFAALETLIPAADGRLAEIENKLGEFGKRHPSHPLSYYLRALVQVAKKSKAVTAERLFREATAADPRFWPAYFELHSLMKIQEKWDEAAALLHKVIELNPDFAPAHYSLGQIYSILGDRSAAQRERKLHHELVLLQRAAREKRRLETPRLPYAISSPAGDAR